MATTEETSGGVPDGITREDVLSAIQDLDSGFPHSFRPSTAYDLVHEGKAYPPQAVLGLAARRVAGRALAPHEFAEGENTKCFSVLRFLGFTVQEKAQDTTLEGRVRRDIRRLHGELRQEGKSLPVARLDECYEAFRDRFAPDRLRGIRGEELLNLMHGHGNRDSMVYWLEFKNDDQLPELFGSIAGGSALKFGIYKRSEDAQWYTGSPQNQHLLTVEEAIRLAERNREQLTKAVALIEEVDSFTDEAYASLERDLLRDAPDVANTSWGHKYLSLLCPTKVSPWNSRRYQRYHILRLLQETPENDGRYVCDGRFAGLASELGIHLNHLYHALNRLHGRVRRYWRVGTTIGSSGESLWDDMRGGGYVGIGFPKIGELLDIGGGRKAQEVVRSLLEEHYPQDPRTVGKYVKQVARFVTEMSPDDIVLACQGATVLGIGSVAGDYYFRNTNEFAHRRDVKWLDTGEWSLPEQEGLRTIVAELGKKWSNLLEVEKRLFNPTPDEASVPSLPTMGTDPMIERIVSCMKRKSQVILFGPPGTGKTYWALRAARWFANRGAPGRGPKAVDRRVHICTFHPSYGYEDFIEGFRPKVVGDRMVYQLQPGIFRRVCEEAKEEPNESFVLVIDEINRGDAPRVFGELLTLLEQDKRDLLVRLPLSGSQFSVPKNVYIIGTMNTADRSIALLDAAFRRRFAFVEVPPDTSLLSGTTVQGIDLGQWLRALNVRIATYMGHDGRNLRVGHAYLMQSTGGPVKQMTTFVRALRDDVIPLLQEYCYETPEGLAQILGEDFFDVTELRLKDELFAPENEDQLRAALLKLYEEEATSAKAVSSAEVEETEEGDEEQDDETAGDE